MRKPKHLIADEGALVTVEFVAIFPFFIILVFYALEVALALYWWQSVQEAAQIGVRMAVISDPAVNLEACPGGTGYLPNGNCKASGGTYGGSCSSGTNCTGFTTVSCTGGTTSNCDQTAFNAICTRMQAIFAKIDCSDITISYADSGLGFAGGPVIPTVTVSVSNVPFNVIDVPILPNIVSTMPTMTAILTGEDMCSSDNGDILCGS